MNDVIQAMLDRRSYRKFKKEQIKDEDLELILTAGKYAPNGRGMQSTIMVVLQDPETIAKVSKMNADVMGASIDPFFGAPTVVVVFCEKDFPTGTEDGSLVIGNMLLAASSLGLGACWIHRAKQVFDTDEGKALMKQWGIEGEYTGVGNCIIGYPDCDKPKAKPRKENFVYYVK